MKILVLLLTFIFSSLSIASGDPKTCPDYKTIICHAGSEINPNYVEICVDFGSLWGHFAHHSMDKYGPCGVEEVSAYACNAGLKHEPVLTPFCVLKDDNYRIASSCGDSKNCLCHESITMHPFDYMEYKKANIPEDIFNNDVFIKNFYDLGLIYQEGLKQAGSVDFNKVATTNEFKTLIEPNRSLRFNLSSSRIGAEYFVDTCWYNPGEAVRNADHYGSTQIAEVSSVFSSNEGYLKTANIQSKIELYCDENHSDGKYILPNNPNYQTSWTPFRSGVKSYDFDFDNSNFCKVRHLFRENEADFGRPWDKKEVVIQTITEVLPEVVRNDDPFNICHVQPSFGPGRKTYTCQTLHFNNGDEYIDYIKTYNNVAAWRQDHQHDYRGICQAVCGPINGNR